MPFRVSVPMSAIIADDEQLAREELRFLLEEIGDVEVVGTATNGLEALDLIEKLDPALAFLDIQMPGLDGLGVVRRLREHQIEPPHVIFSTAFDQFAVEAFKLEAMDYLLKPVDRERLVAAPAEGQSNFRTIEELQAALDPDMFWRAHRSYLVNVNRIREVVPWFKSTYQLRMDDKKASEIPVSRLQSRRLREMLNL